MVLRRPPRRSAVAAVELAVVAAFLLVPLIIGVWEVGRLVQVQQLVSNSAREGARLASQGYTVNASGTPTEVTVASGPVNITDAVYQFLLAAGLTNLQKSDIQVDFAFTAPNSGGTTPAEPYLGEKGQPFRVTVTIKSWAKVRWIDMGILRPADVTFTANWQMLVDDKFTVNQTLPAW